MWHTFSRSSRKASLGVGRGLGAGEGLCSRLAAAGVGAAGVEAAGAGAAGVGAVGVRAGGTLSSGSCKAASLPKHLLSGKAAGIYPKSFSCKYQDSLLEVFWYASWEVYSKITSG